MDNVVTLIQYFKKHSQDSPLLTWTKYRGDYLDACLILESRGRFSESCGNPNCGSEPGFTPTFRCLDCFGNALFCKECIIFLHHINPLHRIQVIAHYFSLYKLNLNTRT